MRHVGTNSSAQPPASACDDVYRTASRLRLLCLGASLCVLLQLPSHTPAQVPDGDSARAFIEQGERQRVRDEYTAAVESYRRALALAERAGDTAAQSRAYVGLGECYTQQMKFSRSLEALQQSLALSEAGGDTAGMGRANNALGYVYYRLYYYDSAERHLSQALAQFESAGDRGGMASVLSHMGRNLASQGDSPELTARILDYYRRAINLGEASGDREALAGALNNLGNHVLYLPEKTRLAISHYERALALYESLGRRRRMGVVLGNLSRAYWVIHVGLKQEGFKSVEAGRRCLDYAERSVSILSALEADDDLWEAYVNLGLARWTLADTTEEAGRALPAFDEAIKVIEQMRREADGDELTLQRYFRGQTAPYDKATELLIRSGRNAEALAYVERAKARVLLDMLQRARVVDAAPASGKTQAQSLNDELIALNGELVRERQKPQPDEARLTGLGERLQQVRQTLLDGQARAANTQPESRRLRHEVQPISLEEMSALLPDEHSALLEYAVEGNWINLFVLTRGAPEPALPGQTQAATQSQVVLKGYIAEKSRGHLNARIADLRQRLATRDNSYRASAREIYDQLLRPAREQLRGKTSLIIVPDKELWDVSFQTLLDEEGRHLIETAAVSYAPSLTALREMRKARREPASNAPAGALLALGNPALSSETIARTRTRYRDARLDPLPEAEKEVAAIGRLYDGKRSRVYTGAGAREELLKEEAGRYEILHLATHAIVSAENPMFSTLVLSQSGTERGEDGLLEAHEIMRLNLRARMVVLSACETARGQASAGEGMMGLSWAFQVAGVPAVVVSQWRVESASTAALMIEFHRQLRTPGRMRVSIAEALRRASLKQLRRDRSLHPFYWAAFVVVGDGE